MIWKKENSYTRKLQNNSELQVKIEITTLRVPALTTEQVEGGSMVSKVENYLITTPVSIWDLLIG